MDETDLRLPAEYGLFLEELKERIRSAQVRAAVAVNTELILLYWNIGRRIRAAQETEGYGTKIVPKLSADLSKAFPEMKGFSPRNLNYMLAFAKTWPDGKVLQQLVAKLPWGHNITLLQKLDTSELRLWYATVSLQNGWSRNVLAIEVDSKLHQRRQNHCFRTHGKSKNNRFLRNHF